MAPPANMDTHLVDGENDGGFAFTNGDSKPITVRTETFDISYSYISTAYGPLVLRLIDPADTTHYTDYDLTKLPAESSSTYGMNGLTFSWPFSVPANDAKFLPVEVLGVHRLSIADTSPSFTITLAGMTTDRTDFAAQPGTPAISWSCAVSSAFYDPNATSGVFASGEACNN